VVGACYKSIILGLLLLVLAAVSCAKAPANPGGTLPASSTAPLIVTQTPTLQTTTNSPAQTAPAVSPVLNPQIYTYRVINSYPHDAKAFTEGLVFDGGFLYEGTGIAGDSSIRRVELKTGKVLQIYNLPEEYFGEGIVIFKDSLIELTWQNGVGLVYARDSFDFLRQFSYSGEGWGITSDGTSLIMSNGTSRLTVLDPDTLTQTGGIEVHDGKTPVVRLNELEFIKGKIYANVWMTDRIAVIEPASGTVDAWIDLTGLLATRGAIGGVLNGIAYDAQNDRLFVTGKLWPFLFEIKLLPNK
jgi:glutaminyl-peptide cyclotransferase